MTVRVVEVGMGMGIGYDKTGVDGEKEEACQMH